MIRCKIPTLQTAFCGHSIHASGVFMGWAYLGIDSFMLLVALLLVIIIGMQNEGGGVDRVQYDTDAFQPNHDWITQLKELTLSYAFTNMLMCLAWLAGRCGLLLGLYKESSFVLFIWCCLSVILMALQLALALGLVILLCASQLLGDIPFLVGCTLILIQLLLYVDAHLYLTLVIYSVKESILKRKRAGGRRFSGRFSRASFGIKRPVPTDARRVIGTDKQSENL